MAPVQFDWLVWAWATEPDRIHAPDRHTAEGIADLMWPGEPVRLTYARGDAHPPAWDVARQHVACRVYASNRVLAEKAAVLAVGVAHYATVQSVASWEAGQDDRRFPTDGTDYDGA